MAGHCRCLQLPFVVSPVVVPVSMNFISLGAGLGGQGFWAGRPSKGADWAAAAQGSACTVAPAAAHAAHWNRRAAACSLMPVL